MNLVGRELQTFGPTVYGGQPVPFGPHRRTVRFSADEVAAFGRFASYGDNVVRILVRLRDGRQFQLQYADQDREAANWLRREMRRWTTVPVPSREVGWRTCWTRRDVG